jgi:hypothetical protein
MKLITGLTLMLMAVLAPLSAYADRTDEVQAPYGTASPRPSAGNHGGPYSTRRGLAWCSLACCSLWKLGSDQGVIASGRELAGLCIDCRLRGERTDTHPHERYGRATWRR